MPRAATLKGRLCSNLSEYTKPPRPPVRPASPAVLHASRRKAVTLRFARIAAERLALALDLAMESRQIAGVVAE